MNQKLINNMKVKMSKIKTDLNNAEKKLNFLIDDLNKLRSFGGNDSRGMKEAELRGVERR